MEKHNRKLEIFLPRFRLRDAPERVVLRLFQEFLKQARKAQEQRINGSEIY